MRGEKCGSFQGVSGEVQPPHLAELLAPDLSGCRLVKRQEDGRLLRAVLVGKEEYSQGEWHP